jgi:transcriptional regulator with XRE-family HTH domain
MVKARGDTMTGDLLSWEPPKVAAGFEPGAIRGSRLASRISQAVALALKSSSLSRAEIAAAMSVELGYQVSENMLANYASEGAEGHRITLERFIALIEVTGCTDLVGFVAERFGLVAVDQRYKALINLHLADKVEAKIQKFKAAEKAKWGAV